MILKVSRSASVVDMTVAYKHVLNFRWFQAEFAFQELVDAIHALIPDAQLPMELGHSSRWRPNGYMDLSRLMVDTGYRPEFEINDAVADYIRWLQAGNPR